MRKFAALPEDHPIVGQLACPLCEVVFKAGDETTLLPRQPASEEDRVKMEAGRPYNAEAVALHWQCAVDFGYVDASGSD